MRRLIPCLCLLLLCAGTALSQNQDYSKWDFTAAFTVNNFETPPPASTRRNLYGFTAAVGGNFRRWAAIEGDITYTTKNVAGIRRSLVSYMVGPRFTKRLDNKMEPFVHALIGGGHLTGFGPSTNGWTGKFGGGLDIVAGKHIAIRVIQIDYYRYHGNLPVTSPKQRLDNAAFTFGIRIF